MFLSLVDLFVTTILAVVGIIGVLLILHMQPGQAKVALLKKVKWATGMAVILCLVLLIHIPGDRVGVVAVHIGMKAPARWLHH